MNPQLKVSDLKILSLGTGAVDKAYHYSEARNWGKIEWLAPILDILMSGVSDTVDYQLNMLFSSAGCANQYLRLQLNLEEFPDVDTAMDNASEKNMRALERAGQTLAQRTAAQLNSFAQLL